MSLTIDIGNSRVKWAEWQLGKIVARGASGYDKENFSLTLDVLFASLKKPLVISSVCVAGEKVRHALTHWVKEHWQLQVDYLETGRKFNHVIHGYENPAEHGADRWAAIIAANYLYPETSLCVIGAGTAITFDFIKRDGRHLGGYILPSYVSMHSVLTGGTANISSVLDSSVFNEDVFCSDVPDNTSDAVNYGLHRLLQSGVRSFCKQAESVLGGSVQVIVVGGFAETLLNYPDMPEMHYAPDLVMQGLYLIKTKKL